jgi:hypothetical protein
MNSFWQQIILHTILSKERKKADKKYSSFQLAKAFRKLRASVIRVLKDYILMAVGIISAAFGLESFLLPNNFIDGGATGISLLIAR